MMTITTITADRITALVGCHDHDGVKVIQPCEALASNPRVRRQGHGFAFWLLPGGEAGRKRLFGGSKGQQQSQPETIRACVKFSYVYRLRTGPEGGPDTSAPFGGVRRIRGLLLTNSWRIPDIIKLTI
jgi:hypothetical protein